VAKFDADALCELRDVRELRIRTGKHPKTAAVIRILVAEDEVFVRSWLGAGGRWYRDLAPGGPATFEFAGAPHRGASVSGKRRRLGRAPSSCGNTSRARTHRRWCAPRSSRPRCGSNRGDHPEQQQKGAAAKKEPVRGRTEVVMRLFYQSFGVSRGSSHGAYGRVLKRIADSAAAPGSSTRGTSVRRSAAGCHRRSASSERSDGRRRAKRYRNKARGSRGGPLRMRFDQCSGPNEVS
jgi:hypothetical protein